MIEAKKQIVPRRIISSILDLTIALIPAVLNRSRFQDIEFSFFIILWIDLIFICCILPVFTKGKTIGDTLLKIHLVSIDNELVPLSKIIIRNAIYVVYICSTLSLTGDDLSIFVPLMINFFILYLNIISNKNKYSEHLSLLDFIFKTKYRLDDEKQNQNTSVG